MLRHTAGGRQDAHNVLDEVGDAQLAQGAQGQAPDGGVLVLAVLGQQVDGQQGEVRVVLGIGGDVEVQHLLQHHVLPAGHSAGHHLRRSSPDCVMWVVHDQAWTCSTILRC